MEITTPIHLLLSHKGTEIWNITPDAMVLDALRLMAEKNVGALPVVEDGRLVGILSERDYARKVILLGRASRETPVSGIMQANPVTVAPTDSVERCMQLMSDKRVRHLPVLDDGRLVGIVSIGDLVNWIIATQKSAIRELEKFVAGTYPA